MDSAPGQVAPKGRFDPFWLGRAMYAGGAESVVLPVLLA